MKIKFEKTSKGWRSDCLDCPGTPPIGHGKTKVESLAALFFVMMFSNAGGHDDPHNWMRYIKQNEPIIINGKTWRGIYRRE